MNDAERKELVHYRLDKAKATLNEIDILIENQLWNTAVNRLYYACFFAVSSLLISKGLKAQTHSGVRQLFGLHFIKTGIIHKDLGSFYSDIFDKRQSSDYDDFVEFGKNDVLGFLITAKDLVSTVEAILYS